MESELIRELDDKGEHTGNLFAPSLTQRDIRNIALYRKYDDVDVFLYIVRNSYAPISIAASVGYYYMDDYRTNAFLGKPNTLTLQKAELFQALAQDLADLLPSGHRYEKERDLALGAPSDDGLENAITHGDEKLVGKTACQTWYAYIFLRVPLCCSHRMLL